MADVSAGTGIGTAVMCDRGADVIAVEPGGAMVAQLHQVLPVVRGDSDALPLADSSRDLITYAQSWQWTEPDRSLPDALRILRLGGALAIWWSTTAFDVPWIRASRTTAEWPRVPRRVSTTKPSVSRA
ncbi:class I SAM-dependent methyltransferase [Saccharopolyspora hirsuta]|uniref:class I SAM-dependent methyltransferase n=1 Tax=Saccharopolyspora hirsuta TaxID=1837 RepID=UPI003316C688